MISRSKTFRFYWFISSALSIFLTRYTNFKRFKLNNYDPPRHCGNISESNNYRSIALATIISKLFESVLLVKCEDYLSTCSNQFGFKKGHSTDLCIYALKEYIEYYKNRNTSVFVTMLDASKAFDRVNFWLLFQKLLSRNVPLFIVRILAMWYTHQKMCIRWGNAISPSFTVSNGVKQGGIISPILFNVYMDGLSVVLNSSNIGGQIGYTFLNHLCYADDLCLISLSSAGMWLIPLASHYLLLVLYNVQA